MSILKRARFWAAAAIPVAACSTAWAQANVAQAAEPVPTPLVYDAVAREGAPTRRQDTCTLLIATPNDLRQNKETIGAYPRGPLLTGDPRAWISEGLMHLRDFGFSVQPAQAITVPTEGLLVKTTLTRAYTWQVGIKLFGMIALKAQFVDKNGVLLDKYYRAHGDKTNMWGAESEFHTTLNFGLNNLLREMAEDLSSLCKGVKVEPFTYAGPSPKAAAK
jgi:hypothetical protein